MKEIIQSILEKRVKYQSNFGNIGNVIIAGEGFMSEYQKNFLKIADQTPS